MTSEILPFVKPVKKSKFQTGYVIPIVGAHFINDTYTAFVAPLLPVIIEKMSLSLTMAGTLTAILQIPALLNPFIGYLADRVSLRYFVIFAPGVTATFICSIGFAPNYLWLAIILFAAGISVACFHAPAPAMIGRVSGTQVGKGMSFFMAAGELGRTVGPLLAVWAVSVWTLDGFYRVVVLGWAATLVLYWRLKNIPARLEKPKDLSTIVPFLRSLFLPLLFVIFFRTFLRESVSTFLPTFLRIEGASLWIAGAALSILELAGVAGALFSGTFSDTFGRKPILLVGTVAAAGFMLIFLRVEGWLLIPVLLALGFTALSSAPVTLAMVQDQMPDHRAVGNGLLMVLSFLLRPIAMITIGMLGDRVGLRQVYFWSAWISLLAIPAILALPSRPDPA